MTNAELETVIAIPPLPFRNGSVDLSAHQRNLEYLLQENHLAGGRKRAIAIGGTSLVHHVNTESLLEVVDRSGQVVEQRAILIAGILPTPVVTARRLIDAMNALRRPPDYYLILPVPGVCNPEGTRTELSRFVDSFSRKPETRFLLYMRQRALLPAFSRMLNELEGVAGVKVGTEVEDVGRFMAAVNPRKRVLWGVGDRATAAARLGSRGHTSGITLICPRACDAIHNAYCEGRFEDAEEVEKIVADFEEIRFREERAFNYSAVVAAAQLAGFRDVDLGDGGPFNAAPAPEVMERIASCLASLRAYH